MKFKQVKFKKTEIGKIPVDWSVSKLEDHLIIKGRIGWKGLKKSEFSQNGFIIINGPNITNGKIDWKNCMRVPKWRYDESKEISVKNNDILMTKDGTIGKTAYVKNMPEPATLASGIFLIRNISKELSQDFLYRYFHTPFFRTLIESRIEGSVIPHLYQRDIKQLNVPLPPHNEQKSIAKILFALDAKIQNLEKQNKILEQIAQAIFKSWFVDFDGVTEFEDSELGQIPKGWMVFSIDKLMNFLNGLALQNYPPENNKEFLPVIKIKELKCGITSLSNKSSIHIPRKYIVENGDILFSWSGSLKVVFWTSGKGALNQHLFKITSAYPKWFCYLWIKKYLPEYRHIAEAKATTMGHIKREHLANTLVVVPNAQILQKINQILDPVIKKIIQANIELNKLSQIRDILLPKLMSGEIRV